MAKLSRDDILKLAKLAGLKLSAAEVRKFQTELSEILGYVEMLKKVNVDDLNPTNQVTGLVNVSRPDIIYDYGYSPDKLLSNVPSVQGRYIKTKRILQ